MMDGRRITRLRLADWAWRRNLPLECRFGRMPHRFAIPSELAMGSPQDLVSREQNRLARRSSSTASRDLEPPNRKPAYSFTL